MHIHMGRYHTWKQKLKLAGLWHHLNASSRPQIDSAGLNMSEMELWTVLQGGANMSASMPLALASAIFRASCRRCGPVHALCTPCASVRPCVRESVSPCVSPCSRACVRLCFWS